MCTKTLLWILGAIITMNMAFFGYTIGHVNNLEVKVDSNRAQFLRIETQLSAISTDIQWIKRELNNQ